MPTDAVRLRNWRKRGVLVGRVCARGDEESSDTRRGTPESGKDGGADCCGGEDAGALLAGGRCGHRSRAHQRAGRIGRRMAQQGTVEELCSRADEIAHAVFDETGLRTVFHHHCAGYVETRTRLSNCLTRRIRIAWGSCSTQGTMCTERAPRTAICYRRWSASRSASGTST